MTILLNTEYITSKKTGKDYTKYALFDDERCDAWVALLEGHDSEFEPLDTFPICEVSVSYDRNGRMIDIKKKGA